MPINKTALGDIDYQDFRKDILGNKDAIDSVIQSLSKRKDVEKVINQLLKERKNDEKQSEDIQKSISVVAGKITEIEERRKKLGLNRGNPLIKAQMDRQLDVMNRLVEDQEKLGNSAKLQAVLVKAGYGKWVDLYNLTKEYNKEHIKLEASLVAFLYISKKIWDVFSALDKSSAEFRKSMGFLRQDSVIFEEMSKDIMVNYARIGISASDTYRAISAITSTIGTAQSITEDMATNMDLLAVQLGVADSTSADFLKSMAMINKSTMDSQSNMTLFIAKLSEAAGTNLSQVMTDISEATKSHYELMSRSPLEMAKASVEARRMGTSLSSTLESSSKLLQFTESVKSEMEASVLVGKSINLQKARELAYHKDIEGLNREILRIAKQTHFENLDPFQQNAVAAALGKSTEEVGKMLLAEREIDKIRGNPKLREQYNQYQKLQNINKSILGDVERKEKADLIAMSNAEALKTISLAWNAIWAKLAEGFLPIIAKSLLFISKVINNMGDLIMKLISPLIVIGKIVKLVITKSFGMTFSVIGKISNVLTKITQLGGPILKVVGKIGVFFLKWLEPIGWVITAFQFLGNLLKEWDKFPKGFLNGLKAIGMALYDTLIRPFSDLWNWCKNNILGKSPSKLGMLIVKGIRSVGGMLVDALLSPFKIAWNLIKKLPFISHFFSHKELESKINVPNNDVEMSVEKPNTGLSVNNETKKPNTIKDSIENGNDELVGVMSSILDSINTLRTDMKNGGIATNVFLDSRKLNVGMGRRLSYLGELS